MIVVLVLLLLLLLLLVLVELLILGMVAHRNSCRCHRGRHLPCHCHGCIWCHARRGGCVLGLSLRTQGGRGIGMGPNPPLHHHQTNLHCAECYALRPNE